MLLTELPKGEEKMAEEKEYFWPLTAMMDLLNYCWIQIKRLQGYRDDWHKS